jgi:hypothetical protein
MTFPGDLDRSGGPAKQLKYEGPSTGWINNYNTNPDPPGLNTQVPTTDGAGNLTFQTPSAGGGGPTFPQFNVKTYGAIGNGVADDTLAINSAIAAFNSASNGILYFPSGNYKVTLPLTVITAGGTVLGDGRSATTITYTPLTGALFETHVNGSLDYRSLSLSGSTSATSGCSALLCPNFTGATGHGNTSFIECNVTGFYDAIDYRAAQGWILEGTYISNYVHYGVRANNIPMPDAGGWHIINSFFGGLNSATTVAGLSFESAGGVHIVSTNFIGNQRGIYIHQGGLVSLSTADILVSNCSFEANSVNHIDADLSGGGRMDTLLIHGCEFDGTAQVLLKPGMSQYWIVSGCTLGGAQILLSSGSFNDVLVHGVNPPRSATSGPIGSNNFRDSSGGIGGGQFFGYLAPFNPGTNNLTWIDPGGGDASLQVSTSDVNRKVGVRAYNTDNVNVEMQVDSHAGGTGAYVQSTNDLKLCSDSGSASGGSDPISFRAGGNGTAAEVFQAIPAGLLKLTNAANFSANGAVATVLGSIGPTGSHTTVQKWLTLEDSTGAKFYIPCF